MTISKEYRKAGPFVGTGSTTTFPFEFKVFQGEELLVTHADSAGVESTLVIGQDYSVTLNPDQDAAPGGSVVLSAPLAVGARLVISSNVRYLQPTNLTNSGGFYPEVLNDALDRVTILTQQNAELAERSVVVPITDERTPAEFWDDLLVDVNTSEANAAASAAQAEHYKNNASDSADAAAGAVVQIRNRDYGPLPFDPAQRPDGTPSQPGDEYFNTTDQVKKVYSGSEWFVPNVDGQALSKEFARQDAEYGPGIIVSRRNQTFWRDGVPYRPNADLTLSYTTTGDWGAEEGLFVAVGDQALRQDLADSSDPNKGAGMVGFGEGTVHDLQALEGASKLGAKDYVGERIDIQSALQNADPEYPISAYGQNAGMMITGPLIVQLARKLRITGDEADAEYNHNVIADVLAGLPDGAEVEFPSRGLAFCMGGLDIDSTGVSFRGSNSGAAYSSFWLKFLDGPDAAFNVKKAGFHMSRVLLAGASNPSTGFGNDVSLDCLNIQMPTLDADIVIIDSGLAFFRDCITVKDLPCRNIRTNNVLFSGSSRAFSYTAAQLADSRGFEFYNSRFHGIGRETHPRSAIVYIEPSSNVRGLTITGGTADFSVELVRGYASQTNITGVHATGSQRGYVDVDSTGHTVSFSRRGFNIFDGSFHHEEGGLVLPSSALSLKGGAGAYVVDGFVSGGSMGHGIYVDAIDAHILNTVVHNASQLTNETYSGYAIGANSARVAFGGGVSYKQGVKGGPANRAKYAFENGGADTIFMTQAIQYGLPAAASYSIAPGKSSQGPDPYSLLSRIAYRNAPPSTGNWVTGSRVMNIAPTVGQPKSWVCTSGGAPGLWVSEGDL